MTRRALLQLLVPMVAAPGVLVGQPVVPLRDWAGEWREDLALSRALTASKGLRWHEVGVAAPAGESRGGGGPQSRRWTVSVTATELTIEERLGAYVTRRTIRFDGRESVATTVISTDRFTASRTDDRILEAGTTYLELRGQEVMRTFTRSYARNRAGHLEVEYTIKSADSATRTIIAVFVRAVPSGGPKP